MEPVVTTLFELFKIGPGPSSSHTLGPMRAGYDFIRLAARIPTADLDRSTRLIVRLFGSLSATGKGHGTDRAVLAGLLGKQPDDCPTDFLDNLLPDDTKPYSIVIGENTFEVTGKDIIFDALVHDHPFSNTLVISLLAENGAPIFEREYYSVGGGFIQWKGWTPPERGTPPYPYSTMEELKKQLSDNDITLDRLMIANEKALTGFSEQRIFENIGRILTAMDKAVEAGISTDGILPGPIGLWRKGGELLRRSNSKDRIADNFLVTLSAYAFAAAEENAAGHIVVTAPTSGSAGVIPAILSIMRTRLMLPDQSIREGLLAAAAVGFLCKHNATIAGAEGGCQAEIGVASAMAAAMLANACGYGARVVENSAETALEHHLGMTCDPVQGYVQIPCIERNAMGAVKAYTAFMIASSEEHTRHKVGLDVTIKAMADTGRDLSCKYKETSQGGLATCMTVC